MLIILNILRKILSVAVVLRSLGLRGRGAEQKRKKSDELINQKAKPISFVAITKESKETKKKRKKERKKN